MSERLEPNALKIHYAELAKQAEKQTCMHSIPGPMVRCPACQEIIKFGRAVLPLLLADINQEPIGAHWQLACLYEIARNEGMELPAIKQEDVFYEFFTTAEKIRESCLTWGKEHNLI